MRIAVAKLSVVWKPDGTTRRVFQVFYEDSQVESVALEPGEEVLFYLRGSTYLAKEFDGIEDPLPETLKSEMLEILDIVLRGDFVDITDKLD